MRETDFIEKNKDKWKRYERALERDEQDPELLKQLYIHTTDDLSYSRTFYPNRSVRVYLNGLAQRTFLQIYRGRRGEAGRFFTFWTDELPRVVYAQRRPLLVSLVTFVLAMLIGVISYRIDPGFAETIMGEAYMNMTQANIADGDPMAVYKQTSPWSMSLRITFNNIFVALLTFVSGAFFAVGAIVQLIRNGVMLGVFQYFFYDQGIFQESFLTIWIHGALEISSIVIAGGAGLAMGGGLLFPETLSRFEAFKASARDGLKIMLGTVPLFIIAGFLEGYLTRHTELPDAIRGSFILLCFAFILWYYVLYPRAVAARPRPEETAALRTRELTEEEMSLGRILTAGENMTTVFGLLRQNAGLVFGGLGLITSLFVLLSFLFYNSAPSTRYVFSGEWWGDFHNAYELLTTFSRDRGFLYLLLVAGALYGFLRLAFEMPRRSFGMDWSAPSWRSETFLYLQGLALALCFSLDATVAGLFLILLIPFLFIFAYGAYGSFRTEGSLLYVPETGESKAAAVRLGAIILFVIFVVRLLRLVGDYTILLSLVLPFLFVWLTNKDGGKKVIADTFRFVYTSLTKSYSSYILILVMAVPTMWLVDTAIGSLLFAFFDWIFYSDAVTIDNANVVLQSVLYCYLLGLLFVIWGASFALKFYTLREIDQATGLLSEIEAFNTKRKVRGIEVE